MTDVIEGYIKGTRDRDIARLKTVFHEAAVMSGYLGPNLLAGSPEPFYAHLEAHPHADQGHAYRAAIAHVSVVGRTAVARLVEDSLYGMSFVNDFHLLQIDGKWSITSKLFHHDEVEP
ncbi:MAG: nuclear transport factor 2 family protein [Myxococcota bacterium]